MKMSVLSRARRRVRDGLLCLLAAGFPAAILLSCGGGDSGSTSAANTAPSITAQPTAQSVTAGQTATFSVTAAGTAPLSYQWARNGIAISGATFASYSTPATAGSDDGSTYSVTVSNAAGSVTSSSVALHVSTNGSNPPPTGSGTDVVTFKNDNGRTGQNLTETLLTPSNVNSQSFGLLRSLSVDGKVDAQPLYLSQLTVGGASHNVVFVATEHASVYAYDADTGSKLWQVTLLAQGETTAKQSDAFGCSQVVPELGITATPAIDRNAGSHGTIYVVAMSKDASHFHQRLHALDVTTGEELLGGPTEIAATYPTSSGTTTFDPQAYEERAALLVANGTIYTSWTSHCDRQPYTGWVIGFSQSSLTRSGVLNVAPNSAGAGPAIWMSGAGPGADAAGNVYFLTANGAFEPALDAQGFPNKQDYGNSFVKMGGSSFAVADYFALEDTVAASAADRDLGSGGELLLPDLTDGNHTVRHLIAGAGKDGNIYVVNRDSLGKFDANANHIWQQVNGALGGRVFASPAYFNNTLYYGAGGASLRAFQIANAMLGGAATAQTGNTFTFPGTSPVVSANGTADAIVWAHENTDPAVLHAYLASDLSHELYNSNQAAGQRDHFGTGNKFIAPVVADGKVFVGTTNSVAVFGLR